MRAIGYGKDNSLWGLEADTGRLTFYQKSYWNRDATSATEYDIILFPQYYGYMLIQK